MTVSQQDPVVINDVLHDGDISSQDDDTSHMINHNNRNKHKVYRPTHARGLRTDLLKSELVSVLTPADNKSKRGPVYEEINNAHNRNVNKTNSPARAQIGGQNNHGFIQGEASPVRQPISGTPVNGYRGHDRNDSSPNRRGGFTMIVQDSPVNNNELRSQSQSPHSMRSQSPHNTRSHSPHSSRTQSPYNSYSQTMHNPRSRSLSPSKSRSPHRSHSPYLDGGKSYEELYSPYPKKSSPTQPLTIQVDQHPGEDDLGAILDDLDASYMDPDRGVHNHNPQHIVYMNRDPSPLDPRLDYSGSPHRSGRDPYRISMESSPKRMRNPNPGRVNGESNGYQVSACTVLGDNQI